MTDLEELRTVIRTYPVIDNHAHNLLLPTQLETYSFKTITTEAHGAALEDTHTSLSHIRATKQLKELYGSDQDDWESITEARNSWIHERPHELITKCFEGTHSILMDDGLDIATVHNFDWHEPFVTGVVRRIVRIEAIAEDIMREVIKPQYHDELQSTSSQVWKDFVSVFKSRIHKAITDPLVAGFKSVICYRTGLAVGKLSANDETLKDAFGSYLQNEVRQGKYRIQSKPLNDWLLRHVLSELNASAVRPHKPIQFHTGLGDNDINLLLSDPSHLQPLIEEYPRVPFIILHSSYPYTRKAGYLATVYDNAYLDIGEVFPMVSRDGQEHIIRQALELAPGSKLLWSTDGHWFPETYWLANKQFRTALEKVLVEYVKEKDLSVAEATKLAKDIFFNNSNRVYKLRLVAPADSSESKKKHLPAKPASATRDDLTDNGYNNKLWQSLQLQIPDLGFVYVQWLDRMGQLRCRVLPIKEFSRLITTGGQIGVSRGNIGTLQNDGNSPAVNPVGQIYVRPDLRSLRQTHFEDTLRRRTPADPDLKRPARITSSATVMASWSDDLGQPFEGCHRSLLERLVEDMKRDYDVDFLIGFEIEITFLERNQDGKPHNPYTKDQAWSTLAPDQWQKLGIFRDMIDALADMGIDIQQFHAESGQGQYEFVLPPSSPLQAIDTLIQARQAIQQLAHTHDLCATLHPSPFPGAGTGAHAHISLSSPSHSPPFFAGVLQHLKSICAFSLPQAESYDRVKDDSWTAGTWVTWGTQNRECPLRRVDSGRWEVRCLDGTANMYLAISAVLGAGFLGLQNNMALTMGDCTVNPSKLDEAQRAELGISDRLPRKLEEALVALAEDDGLKDMMGRVLVDEYLGMKEAEQGMLGAMRKGERRAWLIERY